ncbi:4Fe-4S dicluster domain-containing protein [Candidatus Bathyarchaeota archaeon]|nr:4Fe-4S dicluster domain-containing protein [Candidatus Bathyarchaeota archaeon]
MEEKRFLFLDLDACTGCRSCMAACSLLKEQASGLGKSRLWVPKMDGICLAVPVVCEQCANAPCENVCPTRAITRDTKTGALLVDAQKCIGCKECVWACPFGAITVRKGLAIKCDLCDGDPECAKVCIPKAIQFVSLDDGGFKKKWSSLEKRVKALATIVGGR